MPLVSEPSGMIMVFWSVLQSRNMEWSDQSEAKKSVTHTDLEKYIDREISLLAHTRLRLGWAKIINGYRPPLRGEPCLLGVRKGGETHSLVW